MLGRPPFERSLNAALAAASQQARSLLRPVTSREAAICDVAAGVAGPTLVGFVMWLLREAERRGVKRLRFLSRDGQIMYHIANRIKDRMASAIDLEYVFSSRLTWSLAASDPHKLSESEWLFNSFMKSNAVDVCARLSLDFREFGPQLTASNVNLDDNVRADSPDQLRALQDFVDKPEVADRVVERVNLMQELVSAYAEQHQLVESDTALVDSGWTGRMVGSLIKTTGDVSRPHILFWGHEPRASGWTDDRRVAAFMYNSARREGMQLRVPDAPFLIETFCMADHGIVAGYQRDDENRVQAILQSDENRDALDWGIELYRSAIFAFCDSFDVSHESDMRLVISALMHEFWLRPTKSEASAWGTYVYDSDPAASAARVLARPFSIGELRLPIDWYRARGDRAWVAGSLALSDPALRLAYRLTSEESRPTGEPAKD